MKKSHILGLALFAVFAFGVLAAASAMAAVEFLLAEWLVNGSPIMETLAVDGESSEIALEETVLGVKTVVLCSGIADGTIGPNGAGEVTALLDLTGTITIPRTLEGSGLACTNSGNCPEPLVWAVGLPYKIQAELMVEGTETWFVGLATNAAKELGYHIECMGGISDLCVAAEAIGHLGNEANGTVDGEASDPFTELAGMKLASCELAGPEGAIISGLGFALLTGTTGSLSVSSEP
jgi:hypothetical protein